mgnify:CR=1 FL=1
MDFRTKSYLTTTLFVVMFLVSMFAAVILQNTPAAFIGIATIIIGIISTWVDNNRATVEGAVEEFKTWKYVQYIITIIVMAAPFIEIFKPNILEIIPEELKPIALILIPIVLTFAAGQREKNSVTPETQ